MSDEIIVIEQDIPIIEVVTVSEQGPVGPAGIVDYLSDDFKSAVGSNINFLFNAAGILTTYSDLVSLNIENATTSNKGLMSAADKVTVQGLSSTYELKSNKVTSFSVINNTVFPTTQALTNWTFTGDSGSGGAVGIVPAPAVGDAAANKYLKANGTWATVPSASVASVFGRVGSIIATQDDYTFAQLASKPTTLTGYGITDGVPTTRTVNGHALSGNISVTAADLSLTIGSNVQAWDTDLDLISGLTPSNDDFMQRKAGVWSNRTVSQVKTDLSLSGSNTGDQTITLTGDITGSGIGSFLTTLANNAVTLAKMANMATASLIYRKTFGSGIPEVNTLITLKADLGLTGTNSGDQTITLTGDITGSGSGSFVTTIGASKVTNAMLSGSIDLTTKVINALSAINGGFGSDISAASGVPLFASGVPTFTSTSGTGNFARVTSPVFVTPALGTPSSGIATNLTGTASGLTAGNVTTNANLSGPITSSGNTTSVANQTGSGSKFVMDTSPTLVTPILGVASATNVTFGISSSVTGQIILSHASSAFTTTIQSGNALVSRTYTWPTNFGSAGAVLTDVVGNGILSWNVPASVGTVTATGGSLTSNFVVLGAGGADTKVSTGITSNGTAQLVLGVNTTTLGSVKLFGNTSGDATIQPNAIAGTSTVVTLPASSTTIIIATQQLTFSGFSAARTITFPDAAITVARTDAANTFTGHQTIEGVTSTGATGTGNFVFSTSPTFTTPILGTPTSVTLTNGTGLSLSTGVTGNLPVTNLNSGTGASGSTFWRGDGTWGTPAGAGTVTASGGSLTSNAIVLGAGTADTKVSTGITTNGTAQLVLGVNTSTLGSIKFFGSTSGDATVQSPVAAGTATIITLPNASSTLPIFGQQITFSGPSAARIIALPDASFTVARTDAANTFTGHQTIEGVTSTGATGTGNLVFSISPTFTTPILGIPTSVTLTNGTGLPISTGISGLGAGVATFLTTPSSVNLASVVTDETGSGLLVFATSPTLVTPLLGTPTSVTLTNATGLPLSTGVTGNLPVGNLNSGTSASSSTFWRGDGTWATPVTVSGTNPTGSVGLTTVNGSAGTFMRSDAAPALDVTISPTWTGVHTFTPTARSSGSASYFTLTIPADTGLTAATESIGQKTVTGTRIWATTGTVSLQRENYFAGPTYASAGASQTFTDVFTVYIDKPTAGTNAIFTRSHTLGIIDSTAASSSITGAVVIAATLGTAGTSVGIGGGNINVGNDAVVQGTLSANGFIVTNLSNSIGWSSDVSFSRVANAQIRIRAASDTNTQTFSLGFGPATNSAAQIVRDPVNGFTLQSSAGTSTWNDANTANSGTVTNRYLFGIAAPTLSSTGTSITDTIASTLYIGDAPSAGTNTTIGTAYSIYVAAGMAKFGGGVAITPRVGTTTSSSTPTPNCDIQDIYTITALAAGATMAAPTGTPLNGQRLLLRIKDNGSAQTLAWNAIYRFSSDLAAPTTTVISKTFYIAFMYNSTDSKWDCLASLNNF